MGSAPRIQQSADEINPQAELSDVIAQLSEISRNSKTTFFALILACVYSYLAIATTTDAALLSNSGSTTLPIIQVDVPIIWFYYAAPFILTVLFIYFHLYLGLFWRCIVRLPLRHPDGRGLDDYVYPWLISSAFIRGGISELSRQRSSALLERWLSLFLAWWLVPIVLLFYWARYLPAHDWFGTALHLALIFISAGFALRFFYTARNAVRQLALKSRLHEEKPDSQEEKNQGASESVYSLTRMEIATIGMGVLFLGSALLFLSTSAINGLSAQTCARFESKDGCGLYSLGRVFWHVIGIEPYSEIDEEKFIAKPQNWETLLGDRATLFNFLETQRALVLISRDMRNMSAQKAFLPGSRIHGGTLEYASLQHAVMSGSRLEDVNLRGVDITDADFQHATILNTQLENVDAQAARFNHARFTGATSTDRSRLSGDFSAAYFDDAQGAWLLISARNGSEGETSMREAYLQRTKFDWTDFKDVDLSGAKFEEATLLHNRFENADFTRAIITNAVLSHSTFTQTKFISAIIRDSFFEETEFIASEFDHAPSLEFSGSLLHDAPRKVFKRFNGFGAVFKNGTRIRNVEFAEADLRFARFEQVEFKNTLFSNADLSGATFEDVDLAGVEFSDVDLTGANLRNARNITTRLLEGACGSQETALPSDMRVRSCR